MSKNPVMWIKNSILLIKIPDIVELWLEELKEPNKHWN